MPPTLLEVRDFVVRIVVSRLHGVPDSDREDICQEAWIATWQGLATRDVTDWRAYSAQVARGRVADFFRRRDCRTQSIDSSGDLEGDLGFWLPPEGYEIDIAVFRIIQHFAEHRAPCADIAIFRYFENLAWDEIGRRLESKTDAAKKQWQRCREFLLQHIGDELERILDGSLSKTRVSK